MMTETDTLDFLQVSFQGIQSPRDSVPRNALFRRRRKSACGKSNDTRAFAKKKGTCSDLKTGLHSLYVRHFFFFKLNYL